MKNTLRNIFTGLLLTVGVASAQYDYSGGWQYLSTNVYTVAGQFPTNKVVHLGDGGGTTSSNRTLIISEIWVGSIAGATAHGPSTVKLFDHWGGANYVAGWGVVGATNAFTNGYADVSVSHYASNLISTYVSTSNVTNYYTNVGIYTVTTTNFTWTTNVLSPIFTDTLAESGTAQQHRYTNLNMVITKGILAQVSSNANITIKYKQILSPLNP